MKKLYIIKAGISFPNTIERLGDFDKWVIDTLANDSLHIKVIDIQNGDALPCADSCLGVIITGSHAMVTQELPWSVKIEQWIPNLIEQKIPTLAICYGHQLLAKSMQGVSDYHPDGLELGTVEITLNDNAKKDILFSNLPKNFHVHAVHSQSVLSLPNNATLLASNKHDKHHAFRIGTCAWGVQFHPEYSADVMRSYIHEVSKTKPTSQDEIKDLIDTVQETTFAAQILKDFGALLLK